MVKIFELSNYNKPFRVRYDYPKEETLGTCILIQSGQMGRYDESTPEVSLYEHLTESLNNRRIGVLRLDMESRENLQKPADSNHLSERTNRIKHLLKDPSVKKYLSPYIICGISLGAQSIIELISAPSPTPPLGVILISCVIEKPVMVMNDLQTIQLIYGGRDYIAYIDSESSEIIPVAAEEYSKKSCRFLLLRPWQTCVVTIYENLGHLLTGEENERSNYAISRLSGLAEQILNSRTSVNLSR